MKEDYIKILTNEIYLLVIKYAILIKGFLSLIIS